MKTILLKLSLIILPVTFLVIGLNFNRTSFSGDPEYAYLLNGINIATLHSVGHTDNPGTPVQIYSAVVLRVAHLLNFKEKEELQTDILRNPDYYVELERKILVSMNALMLLFLGLISLLLIRNVWLSLILQATPFISSNLLEIVFTKVSPEPLLVFIIMIMILLVLRLYVDYDKEKKNFAVFFGIISGAGLATKATFLPLAILPVLLLRQRKHKLLYLAVIIPSFVLFTFPAIPEYPHMAKWFLGLTTHTGTYGQGGTGFIDFGAYFKSLPEIIMNNLAMSLALLGALALCILVIVKEGPKNLVSSKPVRFAISIAIIQFLGILMVAKHYHTNHYLIPCISLTGLFWVFTIHSIKEIPSFIPHSIHKFLAPGVLVIMMLFAASTKNYLEAANHGYIISNQETEKVNTRLKTEFAGYVKAYYYPVSINVYSALRWGSVYSRQLHLDALKRIYPDGIFYDIRINRFQLWEATLPVEELVKEYGPKILLVGGPMSKDELISLENAGLSLKEIYYGRIQSIYEVDTTKSSLFNDVGKPEIWSAFCGAETISDDEQWFQEPGFKFQNSKNQSSEQVRNGSFAAKLPYRDTFAMSIEIDSVVPGQRYKFSAWRKGPEGTSFLVASSVKEGEMYQQNGESLKTDEKGWSKILLDLNIPENFTPGKIKFYLWNSTDAPCYFDDLELKRIK